MEQRDALEFRYLSEANARYNNAGNTTHNRELTRKKLKGKIMRDYEKEVLADFKKYENVAEPWPLYDSVIICNQLLGSEANVPGWFTTFAAFSAREQHVFFKNRTDGTAGEQYCNLKNGDSMDFAYEIHSIGLEITCTPTNETQIGSVDGTGQTPNTQDYNLPQWWRADFPWHCGVQLRVQQDIRWEGPAMSCPAGFGGYGSGLAYQQGAIPGFGEIPWMVSQTTQGEPVLSNRQPFPEPIGVPRTGSLEVILTVGEWARRDLAAITGPHEIVINVDGSTPFNHYFSRYMIRASLFGRRLVQQRAQYHR